MLVHELLFPTVSHQIHGCGWASFINQRSVVRLTHGLDPGISSCMPERQPLDVGFSTFLLDIIVASEINVLPRLAESMY